MTADFQGRRHLWAVVGALRERDRQCLLLRAEGLSYREIAGTLGIPHGVAKSLGLHVRAADERHFRRDEMTTRPIHALDDDLVLRLDGELAGRPARTVLDAHLAQCDACRERLAALMDVSAALADGRPVAADDAYAARARGSARALRDERFPRMEPQSGVSRLLSRVRPQGRLAHAGAGIGAAAALALAAVTGPARPARPLRATRPSPPSLQARPNVALTPGATWEISAREICSRAPEGSPSSRNTSATKW